MPPEAVPSNASVALAGKGIRYVGDFIYAYSGLITINDETKTGLSFVCGSGVINGVFTFGVDLSALGQNKLIGYDIFFNDVKVYGLRMYTHASFVLIDNDPVALVIPPFTTVEIKHVTTSASDNPTYGALVGRVHGVE